MSELLGLLPHSAAVHLPLAMGIIMPLMFAVTWVAVAKGLMPEKFWLGLGLFSIVQLGAIALALLSGERAEFLSSASTELIERHEEGARVFGAVWILLACGFAGQAWRPQARIGLRVVLSLLLLVQLGLAVAVGHHGGQLMR